MENVVTSSSDAARYRRSGWWTPDTLSSRVGEHASEGSGGGTAVIDRAGERSRTYQQLARNAARVAGVLADHGVQRGDVVSIQLPNCYEAVVAAVAVNSLGGVINPLLPNYRARELAHVFTTARPKAIFTAETYRGFDHRGLVETVAGQTGVAPFPLVVSVEGPAGDPLLDAPSDGGQELKLLAGTSSSDVSELIFTSGTEATPKAVMHTEETANFAVRALFADLAIAGDHVVWMPSPVGHSTGFNYGIRAALHHALPLVLQDRWDARDAVALVNRFGCTYTLAATTFLEDLVSECERSQGTLATLSHFGCGGAPVPAALVARAQEVGITVLRLYGSTEVLCATWNRPESPFAKRASTDGYPLQHTEIEVRDETGGAVGPATPGELYVRGPNTSVGFFQDPERTAKTYLDDGWVRSGDLVTVDADRYLTVVGRQKEIIIRGGVNIAPREIEDLLSEFPEVRQAAVVPLPDERLGERGCACLLLHPGCELDFHTMVERLRKTGLATYKLPERMIVLEAFPVTPSGKVQKHEIVRRIQVEDGILAKGEDA